MTDVLQPSGDSNSKPTKVSTQLQSVLVNLYLGNGTAIQFGWNCLVTDAANEFVIDRR
jgi:hypothetical protein